MNKALLLLVLSFCSCAQREHITYPDHSEKAGGWFCQRDERGMVCLEGREVLVRAIQALPMDQIEEIKLAAPDKDEEEK